MAGDWIKVDTTIGQKPVVLRIAKALGMSRAEVIGGAVLVWIWFDQHTANGNASVTLEMLSEVAGVKGLAEAMASEGWLSAENGAVSIVDFDVHNSKSAKVRALGMRRAQRHRNAERVASELPEIEREREITHTRPTIEKAMEAAARLKLGEACVKKWFLSREASAWRGIDPTRWQSDLESFGISWQQIDKKRGNRLACGLSINEASTSVRAMTDRVGELERRGTEQMGRIIWRTPEDAAEAKQLKARIRSLGAEIRAAGVQPRKDQANA